MIGNRKKSLIGQRVYFQEVRGDQEKRWYVGKVIGFKRLQRQESTVFGNIFGTNQDNVRTWDDNRLLVETSDKRRVAVWEADTFEGDE